MWFEVFADHASPRAIWLVVIFWPITDDDTGFPDDEEQDELATVVNMVPGSMAVVCTAV